SAGCMSLVSYARCDDFGLALALRRDLGCFREPGAGPLGIIQSVQLGRHLAAAGAGSSQGRHGNAVRQCERSYFEGGKEFNRALGGRVLHGAILLCGCRCKVTTVVTSGDAIAVT